MSKYVRSFYEPGMQINRFCRVCYNTRNYREPSGMYGKPSGTGVAKLSDSELYETKRGFGHEEWLDNADAKISAIRGFSQGFIQRTKVTKTDRNLYNVALWARFSGSEDEFSGIAGPMNPPPGSCWLIGFITHLAYVGQGTLHTRVVNVPFPNDVTDRLEPERRFCALNPNVLYPEGCMRILPRRKWIMAPRAIPHRYNWPLSSNPNNADLFEWAQAEFDRLGPKLNAVGSRGDKRFETNADAFDLESDFAELIEKIKKYCGEDPKTKQRLAVMRTHQADFRQVMMILADGRCMLSGVERQHLLVASHIKPFSLCRSSEAYNPENGLLLARNIDALFDAFLISFDSRTGALIKAKGVENELLAKFGIIPSRTKLPQQYLTEGRCKYLKWHNDELARRADRVSRDKTCLVPNE